MYKKKMKEISQSNPRSKGRKIAIVLGGTLWWKFDSFSQATKMTGIPYQTLYYWWKNKSNRVLRVMHLDEIASQDEIRWMAPSMLSDILKRS